MFVEMHVYKHSVCICLSGGWVLSLTIYHIFPMQLSGFGSITPKDLLWISHPYLLSLLEL